MKVVIRDLKSLKSIFNITMNVEKKRYESRLLLISLFIILILGIIVSLLDPSGLARNGESLDVVSLSGLYLAFFWVGLGLIFSGIVIRLIAIATLKKNYSSRLRIREEHTLVRNGIYHWIRHPVYLGLIITYVGVPVLLSSVLGLLVMFLVIPLLIHRIKLEEMMLIERFGTEYENYVEHSKKLIPYIY